MAKKACWPTERMAKALPLCSDNEQSIGENEDRKMAHGDRWEVVIPAEYLGMMKRAHAKMLCTVKG